jgi:hypothetical protein
LRCDSKKGSCARGLEVHSFAVKIKNLFLGEPLSISEIGGELTMHRTAFTALAAAAVATGALGIPAANAATLEELLRQNLQVVFEDDSAEDLNVDRGTEGVLDEGDTLRGVFSFPFIRNTTTGERIRLDGTTNSALHGLVEVEVTDKTEVAPGVFNFTFGPHEPFAADVGDVEGATVGLWESSTELNPSNCGDKGDCEDAATAGTLRLVLGGEDITWVGTGGENIDALRTTAQGTSAAQFNFGIDVLEQNFEGGELPFIPVTAGDISAEAVGSGQLLGSAGLDTEFAATDDADIQVSVIPIPAALPLFLAGLGALGMVGWRRNAV